MWRDKVVLKKIYKIEREGQIDFFENYGIPYSDQNSVLFDNTDGVYNGNIFEFKLNISDLNKTLFQAIKYLSKMRLKGQSVPATILLIDLNNTKIYVYKSINYFDAIHKIYTGAASKNNDGFMAGPYETVYDYSDELDSSHVRKILLGEKIEPDEMYMPIDIDENCIIGWAERYYREKPKANKGDFLGDNNGNAVKVTGEIRNPRHFKGLINPYTGKSNEKFKYLMDCLNDKLSKKDLGAFYTPMPYAKKAAELVQVAVKRVPKENDYIILDRCAGTGNLECALIGLKDKNGDDLISHCVVSTYEYYEYKVLQERIGSDVREIIPPTEANVVYENGRVANADAMSEDFINNPIIKQYIDNPKCSIILFENPPYHDESSTTIDGRRVGEKSRSYVLKKMKEDELVKGAASNEIANHFIWSGFKFYMRCETDSYILFAPVKYFKLYLFCRTLYEKAFIFNRKYFHASPSALSCIWWANKEKLNTPFNILAMVYDIDKDDLLYIKNINVKQCFSAASCNYSSLSELNLSTDDICNIHCSADGSESIGKKVRVKSYYRDDIIGYLEADSFTIAPMHRNLVRLCLFNGNGCYLSKNNYLGILPIWVAKHVPLDKWYEKDIYATTADGGDAYTKDKNFLKSCLIYTCLSNQNKCLSFDGSDGRRYQNELCFDDNALALKDLKKYQANKITSLDDEEKDLLKTWDKIISEARETKNYNPEFNYGIYQITKELNTFIKTGTGKSKKIDYDYPVLNSDLITLRTKLKQYYKSHITQKMFKYELLK